MAKLDPILPTAEEAERIKAGNRELINRYYMENYPFIRVRAWGWARKRELCNNFYEDLAQDAYLHFSEYNFESAGRFVKSLHIGFNYCVYDGRLKYQQLINAGKKNEYELSILDAPVSFSTRSGDTEQGATLGEVIPCEYDFVEEIEPRPDITDEFFNYLCALIVGSGAPRFPKCQLDVFREVYYTGFPQADIGELLGMTEKQVNTHVYRYMKKLREKRAEIALFLMGAGYNIGRMAEAVGINYGGM